MPQVGSAYVRIRPTLDAEEAEALERLRDQSRALADGIDGFLAKFPRNPPVLEEEKHD